MAKAKKLASGNWRIRVYIGTDATGKKMYKSITKPTKKQAELAALEMQMNIEKYNTPSELTVKEAIENFINLRKAVLSPSTIYSYNIIKNNHMQELMPIKLSKLTQEKIQIAINKESEIRSPKTVRNAHGLLSSVLKEYSPDFRLTTKLPQKEKFIPHIPTHQDIEKIISLSKTVDIELPVLLSIWLGLRMSEIKALTKSKLNGNILTIDEAIVTLGKKEVLKNTKTYSSTRKLYVHDYLCDLINKSDTEYLVTITAPALYQRFTKLCKRNDLPPFRFHDLRHANASVMLALGIPDKYAMERMGHATTNMLKTVYQHTINEEKTRINDMIDTYFFTILDDTKDDTKK